MQKIQVHQADLGKQQQNYDALIGGDFVDVTSSEEATFSMIKVEVVEQKTTDTTPKEHIKPPLGS